MHLIKHNFSYVIGKVTTVSSSLSGRRMARLASRALTANTCLTSRPAFSTPRARVSKIATSSESTSLTGPFWFWRVSLDSSAARAHRSCATKPDTTCSSCSQQASDTTPFKVCPTLHFRSVVTILIKIFNLIFPVSSHWINVKWWSSGLLITFILKIFKYV